MFNLKLPFFAPLWRRILTSGFAAGWALVELLTGSPGWAVLFGAVAGWTIYNFFIAFDPADYEDKNNG